MGNCMTRSLSGGNSPSHTRLSSVSAEWLENLRSLVSKAPHSVVELHSNPIRIMHGEDSLSLTGARPGEVFIVRWEPKVLPAVRVPGGGRAGRSR